LTTTEASGHAPASDRARRGETARALGAVSLDRLRAMRKVVRPLAWVLIAAALVLWVTGELYGWFELIVAAVVAAIAVILCVFFLFGRTAYDIALDLGRTRVVVGERAVGALTLANRTGRAILPSRVVLPVGGGRGSFSIGRLAPGEEAEELFAIPTHRRGVLQVGPVSVVRGDPLGLFERVHRRDDPVDLYVHPRTVSVDGQSLGFLRDLEGLPATDLSPDDVSFHALREYQPGDDLRHVHWRSTARVGTIMVRQYEETRRSHFVIGLTRHPADYRTEDEFELAVSIAGSLGLRGVHDSMQVELRTQGRTVDADTGKRLLDALTTVEFARTAHGGVERIARGIATDLTVASIVVLVVGARTDVAALRAACARMPYGTRVLLIAAKVGSAPALQRIGDADLISVGSLDDLPRALRKVLS
jgi:uncharacterized protein (DUF58 family)